MIFIQEWTKLDQHEGKPCPARRAGHAAVCLNYGGDRPQVFITGGFDHGLRTLSDGWILDVESGKWRKVSSLLNMQLDLLLEVTYVFNDMHILIKT